ncbi:TRAF-LIKE FAMILY PROTEIN [Salix koriyanagi]|nr:TRAF-LIKE FAMILY PROTEIN [Salix koriyanagi]
MADTSSLPLGWEIHVIFRLFLLDQNKDSYLVIQAGKERRFHGLKLEWGFDEFIQLSTFNDSRYGFLVEDTCVLGAEVFVCRERSRGKGEVLSMTKQPATFKYTWKIENFLKLDEKRQESQIFKFTDKIRWKILLYPKGKDSRMGTHLSLYLALDLETLPAGCRLYVDYTLRIVDQVKDRKLDLSAKAKHWFGASSSESGWTRYVSLDRIYQSNHAYVIQDICIIEAEVIVLGIGSAF